MKKVVQIVRKYLEGKKSANHIRCLVTIYGLPLKISGSKLTPQEENRVEDLKGRRETLKDRLKEFEGQKDDRLRKAKEELNRIDNQIRILSKVSQRASFDSELALVLEENYSISG